MRKRTASWGPPIFIGGNRGKALPLDLSPRPRGRRFSSAEIQHLWRYSPDCPGFTGPPIFIGGNSIINTAMQKHTAASGR